MTQSLSASEPEPEPDLSADAVLVVDDDAPCLASLRAFVECEGHACVAVGSAAEARTWCTCRRPSAVVTDLEMPGGDGRSLAGWLRARHPGVPLALVTGRDLQGTELGDLASVFDAVLPKPVDLDRLAALLTAWTS